jgi:hypothetical protein
MGTVLSIIAVAVLLVLLAMSTQRWRAERAAQREAIAIAHTGEAEAQHAESIRRRAEVRAAHAERVATSGGDAQRTGSEPDR